MKSEKRNNGEQTASLVETQKMSVKADPAQTVVPMDAEPEIEVPKDELPYIKGGLIFLMATLGVFLLWAGFVPLSSALMAPGEVVVSSYRKAIQHLEGGTIKKINVKNGDMVEQGDVLIEMDTTAVLAQKNSTTKLLYTAQAALERLIAEQRFAESLEYSDELKNAAQADQDVAVALEQQHQLFEARMKAFRQERGALQTRKEQIDEQIQGLVEQEPLLLEQIELLQEEEQGYSTLLAEGLGDAQRARELKRSILSTKNQLIEVNANMARLKVQLTESNLQVAHAEQAFLKEVGESIKKMQGEYYQLLEKVGLIEDRLTRSQVTAPASGEVVGLQVHTVGSVAGPGATLLELVPQQRVFVVEAKLETRDINDVYIGQPVDIRFSAFNTRLTRIVEGEVEYVSADRLLNERDGTPYYLVRVAVDEEKSAEYTGGGELLPGMPAEVMIRAEERTLFSYLLRPLTDSFARSFKEL